MLRNPNTEKDKKKFQEERIASLDNALIQQRKKADEEANKAAEEVKRKERLERYKGKGEEIIAVDPGSALRIQSNHLREDLQRLIWSLGLEEIPESILSVASANELTFEIAEGPINEEAMLYVLKAAMTAIEHSDSEILNAAKNTFKGQFNIIKTKLSIVVSLDEKYFADAIIKEEPAVVDQPGYCVHEILIRVDALLAELNSKRSLSMRK